MALSGAISFEHMPQISRFSSLSQYLVQLRVGENGFRRYLSRGFFKLLHFFSNPTTLVKV